jgi:hypothetical protein
MEAESAFGGRGESFPPDPLDGELAPATVTPFVFPLAEGPGGDHPLPAAEGVFSLIFSTNPIVNATLRKCIHRIRMKMNSCYRRNDKKSDQTLAQDNAMRI